MNAPKLPREPAPAWVLAPIMSYARSERKEMESWLEEHSVEKAMQTSMLSPDHVKWGVSESDLLNELDKDAPFGTTGWGRSTDTHGHGSKELERVRFTKADMLTLRKDAPMDQIRDILASVPGRTLHLDYGDTRHKAIDFGMEWNGRYYVSKDGLLKVTDTYGGATIHLRAKPSIDKPLVCNPHPNRVTSTVWEIVRHLLSGARGDLHAKGASLATGSLPTKSTHAGILKFLQHNIELTAMTDKWRKPGKEELANRVEQMLVYRDKRWRKEYQEGCRGRKKPFFKEVDAILTSIIKHKGRIKKEKDNGKSSVEHGK